jgi:hypothetical protein
MRRFVERFVPRNRHESGFVGALRADPAQRRRQPIGVVLALGIARDLGADDADRIIVVAGTAHFADPPFGQQFDFQCADAGAIVRAGRRMPSRQNDA